MAKIYLNIEADDVNDLHSTLGQILEGAATVRTSKADYTTADRSDGEQVDAGAIQDAEPGERQRRARRTKAQIEADNAATAARGFTADPVTVASGAGAATALGSQGTGAATGQQTTDPFAEQIREVVQTAHAEAGAPTLQTMRAAMAEYLGGNPPKHTAKEVQELFKRLANVENIGGMDPQHYPAVLAALQAG